jgi:hypothetical protein
MSEQSTLTTGPMQGRNTIGEVTEALHRFLLDGWKSEGPKPRIEEDLSFVPKDREEVVYVYMYKTTQNTSLINSKRRRMAKFTAEENAQGILDPKEVYWERPPLYLELHYLIAVHSKFRSDAERLLGWLLLRLHEATHLLYRPRKYLLPDGQAVDSTGNQWGPENTGDEVIYEKVALALVDDLTVGDAINFFTIHEAPYVGHGPPIRNRFRFQPGSPYGSQNQPTVCRQRICQWPNASTPCAPHHRYKPRRRRFLTLTPAHE